MCTVGVNQSSIKASLTLTYGNSQQQPSVSDNRSK